MRPARLLEMRYEDMVSEERLRTVLPKVLRFLHVNDRAEATARVMNVASRAHNAGRILSNDTFGMSSHARGRSPVLVYEGINAAIPREAMSACAEFLLRFNYSTRS